MQDEELLRRLSKLLRSVDDPRVELIVDQAREAAAREATAILEALLTRAILERAVDQISLGEHHEPSAPVATPATEGGEPPAPSSTPGEEPDRLWYAYGVQRVDAEPPEGVVGITGASIDCVEAGELRAIVSTVTSADFGQSALVDHFDDLEWVGTNAQAHEAVLGAALADGPVLPLRFGTVFRDHESVVEVLRRHEDELLEELDRMTGRCEWGAKAVVDIDTCDRWITEHSPGLARATTDPAATDGRAYLARKQAQRGTSNERHRLLLEISGEIHERLSGVAVDSTTDPPQQRQLSGHEGEMILNGAYLVDSVATDQFHEAADALTERFSDRGVVVQTTGPWPPHHFIALPPLGDLGEQS